MTRIESVVPQDGYKLNIILENGSSIVLNLEDRLDTVRFKLLADKVFFESVTTDGNYLRWDNKIEIAINEVFQLAQKDKQ